MKKMFGVLAVIAALLAVTCEGVYAQPTIEVAKTIFDGRFAETTSGAKTTSGGIIYYTVDSAEVDLYFNYDTPYKKVKLVPDSVKLRWSGRGTTTTDSIAVTYTVVPKIEGPMGYKTRYLYDSIKAGEFDYKKIGDSLLIACNKLKIVTTKNNTSPTQHISNGGAKLKLEIVLYYKDPD